MQYLTLALALAATAFAQGPPPCFPGYLCYNVTAANAYTTEPNCPNKFTCLNTETWLDQIRDATGGCFEAATREANANDGCGYDDFACHCTNYQAYSKVKRPPLPSNGASLTKRSQQIIEPLVFPASLGGQGACTLEQLGGGGALVNDLCNYFNATRYAAYATCPRGRRSTAQTLKRVASSILYIYDAAELAESQRPAPPAEDNE